MPTITSTDAQKLIALREAARKAYTSAQLLRATQGAAITRTHTAMRELWEAVQAADGVAFREDAPAPAESPAPKRAPRKKAAK